MSNAVKYTQDGGKIRFYIEECDEKSSAYAKFRFIVKDNGLGMAITRNLAEIKALVKAIRDIKSGGRGGSTLRKRGLHFDMRRRTLL